MRPSVRPTLLSQMDVGSLMHVQIWVCAVHKGGSGATNLHISWLIRGLNLGSSALKFDAVPLSHEPNVDIVPVLTRMRDGVCVWMFVCMCNYEGVFILLFFSLTDMPPSWSRSWRQTAGTCYLLYSTMTASMEVRVPGVIHPQCCALSSRLSEKTHSESSSSSEDNKRDKPYKHFQSHSQVQGHA